MAVHDSNVLLLCLAVLFLASKYSAKANSDELGNATGGLASRLTSKQEPFKSDRLWHKDNRSSLENKENDLGFPGETSITSFQPTIVRQPVETEERMLSKMNIEQLDGKDSLSFGFSGTYVMEGRYLYLKNWRGVRLTVSSPSKLQRIVIESEAVTVNDKVVCNDISKLGKKRTYQVASDGAKWYTNLKVGRKMTTKEIQQYEKEEHGQNDGREEKGGGDEDNVEDSDSIYTSNSAGSSGRYVLEGRYLYLRNWRGVRLSVSSPSKLQHIVIESETVTVNDKVVCNDISKLGKKRTHQVASDGAKWYTNLNVGRLMTTAEIQKYKKEDKERNDDITEGDADTYVMKGKYLYLYNWNGVRLRMASPSKSQRLVIKGKTVTINGKFVCRDISKLLEERKYQVAKDGAKWRTNLEVGRPMTEEEKEQFQFEYETT